MIIFAGGGWYLYNSMSESAEGETKLVQEEIVNDQAAVISAFFAPIINQFDDYADDASIVRLFGRGDKVVLEQEAERRINQFESALKLRLLIPGQYEIDTTSVPPLGFASLDLLRQAKSSSAVINPEVLMLGTDNAHIVMVARVNNDAEELIGLIHLSLGVELLEQAMSSISGENVYMELQQPVAGRILVLAGQGSKNLKQGEPVISGINGTGWNLAYWSGTSFALDLDTEGSGMAGIAGIIVLVILLVVVVVYFVSRRPRTASVTGSEVTDAIEPVVYSGAIKAIMNGAHPGMEKLISNLESIKTHEVGAKSVSQGLVGDDITMIVTAEDLKAAAESADVFDITQGEAVDSDEVMETNAVESTMSSTAKEESAGTDISPKIFRTYDIRGVVGKDLTPDSVNKIGQSIGSEAAARDQKKVVVGRDGRNSSPELAEALISGLQAAGRDIIDIGMVPTPVLYFATHTLDTTSGVMLTGSHNGPEYNGLKVVLAGETLSEDAIQRIYKRIVENDLESGQGSLETKDITADYIRRISEDIPVALSGAFKLVVDCGNGVAGALAPQLYRALGHDVIELFCEIDGNFPNHHPDPSQPENLQALIDKVRQEQADLGFAFDGDGDRLGMIDGQGNIIWPDRQLMILARDVLSRNKGAEIIYDVKCSRHLKSIIESSGGRPLMWKTGHSLIKSKMKEVNAPLAGEMSGHIFFKERWYGFDDALYAGARLLEVFINAKAKPAEIFAEIPEAVSTPELKVDLPEDAHQPFMGELKDKMVFDGAEVIDIDGIRVEFSDGWGLVRPSNTTPCLVLRFEADNQEALQRIQAEFHELLLSVNPDLSLPF